MKRPTAGELMEHPWIVQFSQEIAREMNSHNEGIEYIQEEEATQGQIYNLDETPEIYTDDSMEPTYENQQEFEEQQQQYAEHQEGEEEHHYQEENENQYQMQQEQQQQ
jgi:hypothetical protein